MEAPIVNLQGYLYVLNSGQSSKIKLRKAQEPFARLGTLPRVQGKSKDEEPRVITSEAEVQAFANAVDFPTRDLLMSRATYSDHPGFTPVSNHWVKPSCKSSCEIQLPKANPDSVGILYGVDQDGIEASPRIISITEIKTETLTRVCL